MQLIIYSFKNISWTHAIFYAAPAVQIALLKRATGDSDCVSRVWKITEVVKETLTVSVLSSVNDSFIYKAVRKALSRRMQVHGGK